MPRFTRLVALGLALLPGLAAAQPAPPYHPGEVQSRFNEQQQRINQGVRSGELTHGEAVRDERHLRHDEAVRNRDLRAHGGHLTPAEQRNLNRDLNGNSGRIYNTKHNDRTVPPRH